MVRTTASVRKPRSTRSCTLAAMAAPIPPRPDVVASTEAHPLEDGEVRLLGAVRQVTGAMTRVDVGGARLLVDCGVAQGRERMEFPDAARDADALVLTHGHLDHIGNVPHLLDGGFDRPIYATPATLEIARVSLEDSLGMERLPEREIAAFLRRFGELARPLPYDRSARVAGAEIVLHEAGHILGSASAEITSAKSRVICSGDLGRPDSPLLRDPNTVWADGRAVDVVVMESTYGSREHAHSHDDIERDLEAVVKDAVASGGKVLVPAFAIGRTQTLLWFLNDLVESGRIPSIPVAVDTPMGVAITRTYDHWKSLFDKEALGRLARGDDPLDFTSLFQVKRGKDSAKVRDMPGPMIVIAGSGMVTGGRILGHLREGLPDPTTTVLFVGYQAEGTPGRRIQNAAANGGRVRVDGEDVVVRAKVRTLKGLSAHADRRELLAWLRAIPAVKRVALHHGDEEAQRAFVTYAAASW